MTSSLKLQKTWSDDWVEQSLGDWLEECREKSTEQDQYPVFTSSREGLMLQTDYYAEGRITQRDNVGFHVIPEKYITYRSRSDDGLFYFNQNDLGQTGIVSHYYPVFHFPKGNNIFFLNLLRAHSHVYRAYSVGTSQQVLSLNALRSIKMKIPPLAEQNKIATVLTIWDSAIEVTERLIANSQDKKRALVQQLLTQDVGQAPSSPKEYTLGDVATIVVSNVDKKTVGGERPVRLCNYVDVYANDRINLGLPFMKATATPAQIEKFGLREGDVIITKDSETPDDIAVPAYVEATADNLVCGYHLAIVRPKDGVDGRYLKFYFEHPRVRYHFASRANGATRYGLTINAIESAPIVLPPLSVQRKISAVIAAAEQEIAALVRYRNTLLGEKKALMQQLLTGKRRIKMGGVK